MLKIVGDICFADNYSDIGYGIGSSLKNGNNLFKRLKKNKHDVWIGNCECVVSDTSIHTNYKKDCFRISPIYLQESRFIDYYCVANNHVMEHGEKSYCDTCDNLSVLGSGVFGSNTQKTLYFEHQDKKVSITSFSLRKDSVQFEPLYWNFPELSELEDEYKKLNSDYKIAYLHWGVEFINYPYTEQVRFAHWLIDLGFDLIIGLHSHILQGYEIYKGKYIFYSLGNFVFDMSWKPSNFSAVVSVDLENLDVSFSYVRNDSSFCPYILSSDLVPEECRFDYLNTLIAKNVNVETYVKHAMSCLKKYRRNNRLYFIKNIYRNDIAVLVGVLLDFIKRKLCF